MLSIIINIEYATNMYFLLRRPGCMRKIWVSGFLVYFVPSPLKQHILSTFLAEGEA